MLRRIRAGWLLALSCLVLLGGMASRGQAAGWVISMRTPRGPMTLYVDEQYGAKMVVQPGMSMISRTDQQRLYRVNETKGVYASMTWSEITQYRDTAKSTLKNLSPEQRAGLQQQMEQMLQQAQNMTPEQRAYAQRMLQRYMRQQGAAADPQEKTYEVTGQTQTINDFHTKQVIEHTGEQQSREFWVATVPDWQRIGTAWENALEPLSDNADNFAVEKLGGLPIRMVEDTGVTEVLSIQSRMFQASDFAPPANSRQVGMAEWR
jgi:hypothetical protein